MTSALTWSRILLVGHFLVCVNGGKFVEPSSPDMTSVAEEETLLPCQFQPSEEQVVQVIWTKENDGTKEQIITAHHQEGPIESTKYKGRVRFKDSDPMVNSALIIMNTKLADEGSYTCTVATFPSGNFEAYLSLTVYSLPISTLDTVTLVEGQTFRLAATCRSLAKPQPGLSWDTDLPGQSSNRSLENGVSVTQFSLHPLRSMNGRKIDCLVWHPTLKQPRRHSSRLVVHYPPDAVITGYNRDWYVGLEDAKLKCDGDGNPKPENITWTRRDGDIPEGVTVEKGLLRFNRPLALTDEGVYECVTTNVVGSGKNELEITISERDPPSFMLIIIGSIALVVVLVLVTVVLIVKRHYKRKNKKLTLELNEKREEIMTLSRQASIRRVGSVNTEHKYQLEEGIPLRAEGTLRTSLSSLDRPRSRDSRSTLGGTVDSLGRPVIYNTSRRGRERTTDRERDRDREFSRLKVESFVKDSNMSLVQSESHFLPPLQPSPYPLDQTSEAVRSRNGSAILPADVRPQSVGGSGTGSRTGSRTGSMAGSRGHQSPLSFPNYPSLTDEEEGDLRQTDEDSGVLRCQTEVDGLDNGGSETTSSQISEALSNHFEHTNGILWPKAKPNNIILAPETTRLLPAHNGIHHHQPQIV
ncbi:nectin-4 isoform X2 [Hoplias malabaricus]|uniref:nectin-4 isoform X2 n=1 Tax=Hoplias malabaricus TaxID=27720 RepID=UPI003461BF76